VIARVLGSAAALIKVYRPALLIWRREEVSSGAVPHPSLAAVVSKGRALDEGQKYPAGPAFSNEESVEWSRVAVMRARADMSCWHRNAAGWAYERAIRERSLVQVPVCFESMHPPTRQSDVKTDLLEASPVTGGM
jgi:hypothetical protein